MMSDRAPVEAPWGAHVFALFSGNKRLALEIFRNKLVSLNWRRKAPPPFAKELLQADLARQILVTVLTALQSSSTRCLHYILSQCYH